MTNVKKLINKEVNELTRMLETLKAKIEQIPLLYPYIDKSEGIEKAEIKKLIALCEGYFSDDLSVFTERVERLAKRRVEGNLLLKSNGRFSLDNNTREFTSGHKIEIFVEDKKHDDYGWQFGRVEHSEEFSGYYFFNESGIEHHKLTTGMKAAIRES
ncbi:hypothetical protein Dtox_1411 [Desulfofarcimen acetoxidans DSM 771]|uniref:DUF5348 domain-containing protein n=1 Tax=Desulfofarcimen acetoxidans (strain ATCC 49208 / DSM 771 / KCTC 5769 / VKM B-1644 / 5575) TaxID=485916 RepID=C8VVH1_DESAS|nr:DUF5348 domain-containing protein [Desulfofarcimen acetoxidans]ACV62286.1 hypothetical protein Dtox_1411 [Desulfofarcimen acetoxidans DSM 771]